MITRKEIIAAAQRYWRRDKWNNEYFDAAGYADFVLASRDAEIQRLQMALADAEALELGTAEKCDKLRAELVNALAACKSKDEAILQENYSLALSFQPDGAGTAVIRLFDLGAKMSFEDQKRLVRELDKIWNGDGAAKQASLCDLVCQLAIEVPKLRTELEAARAEIEQLMAYNETRTAEVLAATQRLAAEQAKNVELREALKEVQMTAESSVKTHGYDKHHVRNADCAKRALFPQSDTSALEAMIAKAGEKMRENVLHMSEQCDLSDVSSRAVALIRALPTITLEDLK